MVQVSIQSVSFRRLGLIKENLHDTAGLESWVGELYGRLNGDAFSNSSSDLNMGALTIKDTITWIRELVDGGNVEPATETFAVVRTYNISAQLKVVYGGVRCWEVLERRNGCYYNRSDFPMVQTGH